MKRYGEVIWSGFAIWTLGAGLMLLLNRETPKWQIVIFLILEGVGVGHTFQPTLVAAQAHSLKSDRAVVISVRNLLRSLGGAIGLSLSSAVFSNSLKKALNAKALNESIKANILSAILRVPDPTSLSSSEKEYVLDSYMMASKAAFTMWAPLIGSCLLLCFAIKDNGLQRAEEKQHTLEPNENETGAVVEGDVENHLRPIQPVAGDEKVYREARKNLQ
jgi:MFS family permease